MPLKRCYEDRRSIWTNSPTSSARFRVLGAKTTKTMLSTPFASVCRIRALSPSPSNTCVASMAPTTSLISTFRSFQWAWSVMRDTTNPASSATAMPSDIKPDGAHPHTREVAYLFFAQLEKTTPPTQQEQSIAPPESIRVRINGLS